MPPDHPQVTICRSGGEGWVVGRRAGCRLSMECPRYEIDMEGSASDIAHLLAEIESLFEVAGFRKNNERVERDPFQEYK